MELTKRFSPRLFAIASCIVILGYLAYAFWVLAGGYAAARQGDTPVYTDFMPKYAASILVLREPAVNLYFPPKMIQAEIDAAQAAYGGTLNDKQARGVGFSAWMYPPIFIFLVYPLAMLPYLASLAAWLTVTAVPYALAMRKALPGRNALFLAFASPPAFYNLMFGQTGFLSGGLIGLGLSQIHVRPALAGVCIGLASVKPHLGVLIPLALVAGEHWKTFWVAALTVAGLIAASILAFGMDPWHALIGSLEFYAEGFEAKAYKYSDMVTVQSMFYLAGASPQAAANAQGLSAVAAASTVIWAWWNKPSRAGQLGLQSAVLCAATLLTVPLAYLYDLVLLMPAAAWIWADMRERGARRAEVWGVVLTLVMMLPLKAIATATHFQYGPLIPLAFLAIALSRLRSLRRQAATDSSAHSALAGSDNL
jgi:alpha-1,2-mannosyltransferase